MDKDDRGSSFQPVPRAHQIWKEKAKANPEWIFHKCPETMNFK